MKLPEGYLDSKGRMIGLFTNLPEAEYHAVKAFSYSGSKQLKKSPAHFQAYLKKDWEIDSDREFYKAAHVLCLEPDMHSKIVVRDGTWARELKVEVEFLQRTGKIVVKQKDLDKAKRVAESLRSHGLAGNILKNALPEVSIFWINKKTGVYCKGRIDALYVDEEELSIGDLKNAGDISEESILWGLITKNKYHWQMANYTDGLETIFERKVDNRYWFFVEGNEPHGVRVPTCTEPMIERALLDFEPLMELYKECEESGVWPGYAENAIDGNLTRFGWEMNE